MRELVDRVVNRTGLERKAAELALKTGFASIAESLGRGETVKLRGFGTFEVVTTRGRPGFHFGRGEVMAGTVGKRVRFRAGGSVVRAVKEGS